MQEKEKEQREQEEREKEQEQEIKEVKLAKPEPEPEIEKEEIGEKKEPKAEEKDEKTEEKPEKKFFGSRGKPRDRRDRRRGKARPGEEKEFDQRLLDIDRVTRVTKGGKRMRFRSLLVIGDRKGRVGYGVAKGADVAISVSKSFIQAKKNILTVPLIDETIPHEVQAKFGAARVILKPARRGSGIKAGGAMRVILELAGVPNVTGKIMGAKNKINNVKATFRALDSLRIFEKK